MMGVGCASEISGSAMKQESEMKQPVQPSLYERLGKKEAITAVIDDFVGRVASDGRNNGKLANANIPRLKAMLVERSVLRRAVHCAYTVRAMKTTIPAWRSPMSSLTHWSASWSPR